MNIHGRELIDHLAREYVLGTLPGATRRRFRAIARVRPDIRQAVARWEERLAPLALAATAQQPPGLVWKRIQVALGLRPPASGTRAGLWAAALAASVVLAATWLLRPPPLPVATPTHIVTLASEDQAVTFQLTVFSGQREVLVTTAPPGTITDRNDYELWAVPPDGGNPVSLGLLARAGQARITLDEAGFGLLERSAALAVSLEPAGGSPASVPTGPVLAAAPLISLR